MSLFDKHKVVDAARNRSGHPLGGFFWRVEEIVLDDDVTSAPDKLEEAVSQMVAVVAEKASNEELQALHLLTSELSRQMERLVQKTAFHTRRRAARGTDLERRPLRRAPFPCPSPFSEETGGTGAERNPSPCVRQAGWRPLRLGVGDSF